jgi:hypothetical protein
MHVERKSLSDKIIRKYMANVTRYLLRIIPLILLGHADFVCGLLRNEVERFAEIATEVAIR